METFAGSEIVVTQGGAPAGVTGGWPMSRSLAAPFAFVRIPLRRRLAGCRVDMGSTRHFWPSKTSGTNRMAGKIQ
jgi:hypothetical protein